MPAKTWSSTTSNSSTKAVGKVNDNTQKKYDQWTQDFAPGAEANAAYKNLQNTQAYKEGASVQAARDQLQNTLTNKPGPYQGQWDAQLNATYDQIMNRDPFSYNVNADALYQQYKDQYTQQGRNAMQDTMAQASAMTGGYGNSYAQTAGQQAYNTYLQQLNNVIPSLYDRAYQRYQDEGNNMLQRYNLVKGRDDTDYGRYRDTMSDYYANREFDYNRYNNERNFDYGQFSDQRAFNYDLWNTLYGNDLNLYNANRSFWQDELWRERNADTESTSTSYSETGVPDDVAVASGGGGGGGRGRGRATKKSTDEDMEKAVTGIINPTAHFNLQMSNTRDINEALGPGTTDPNKQQEQVAKLDTYLANGQISVLDYNDYINKYRLQGISSGIRKK